ncbi:hypothetical protein BS50DRAFT_657564 [Corynespora cassiicola Philippines]|uniref:CoA-dependent acyltransferase n=1 Tax=Corynespora cassiicola Philippines TaxID=1448308 RepID=A0A2T2P2D0_CORCC|nr:hypothetical protein BS50DRAFT_657564 [Corynespora cassiicola Philippines]
MASWQKAFGNEFSRPIGENETFIKLIGDSGHSLGREHWAINVAVALTLKGQLASEFPSQLRKAWGHLRFQHPSIATYPKGGDLAYNIPSSADLGEWIGHTFRVDDDAESASQVIRNAKPNPSAALTFVTKSGELLGNTAHWRTDGIGFPMLLDALLKLVVKVDLGDPASLSWGEEIGRLAPSIEGAAGIPEHPNEEQKALGQSCLATFGLVEGAVGIPFTSATTPGGTLSARMKFSKLLTRRIVDAKKELQISVTSAVHASVAFANWKLADQNRKTQHYTSTVRFNMRSYLPEPFSGPKYASGLYTSGWMEKVESTDTWEKIASHYNAIYQKGISKKYLEAHREYAKGLGDMLRNLPRDLPQASDVDISSIGIVENLMKRSHGSDSWGIDVTDMSLAVNILTPQAVFFVWTFQDQLNLNVAYNEAYHSEAQMQGFPNLVKSILLDNFQLKES